MDTKQIPLSSAKYAYGTNCLICNGSITLTGEDNILLEHGKTIMRVCDDCKQTIAYMKKKMKEEDTNV